MNKDLTILLYQAINEAQDVERSNMWHASSIAKCPRALYLERLGIAGLPSNEPSGGKKLRWRAGHAIEATIRPELEKIYPELQTNVRITNSKLGLTGEFDAYDPVSEALISVKSVHDFAMITRDNVTGLKQDTGKLNPRGQKIWTVKTTPYIHHEWQEHAYVLLHGADTNFPITTITYVYITLGGLIACYTTPVKPEILKRVESKVAYLNLHWSKQELPACLCQEGQEMWKEQNQYCPWKTDGGCCDIDPATELQKEVYKDKETV